MATCETVLCAWFEEKGHELICCAGAFVKGYDFNRAATGRPQKISFPSPREEGAGGTTVGEVSFAFPYSQLAISFFAKGHDFSRAANACHKDSGFSRCLLPLRGRGSENYE